MTASKLDGCDPNSDGAGGNDPPPHEQNHYLQDQIQCTIPTPDCNIPTNYLGGRHLIVTYNFLGSIPQNM